MIRCINIDWLEVYCLEPTTTQPLDADFYESHGWRVSRREYGTRVYEQMFTIFDTNDVPMLEVRRKPLSDISRNGGLFDERSCHIRMCNNYCYMNNPIDILRKFLARYNYIMMRIFRIDIALDFTTFDKGDDPQKFIKRYVDGKYSKVNQTKLSAHGEDKWESRSWNSLSWGKPKSMISTKMYCKTLELKQVKDKPYIRQAWWHAGLIDNPITGEKRQADGSIAIPPVWRVEFSIKSSAKKWYIIERSDTRKQNKIAMPHTLNMYETREKLTQVFASLCRHYFRFKIYEKDKRKDRCADKILFDFRYIDTYYEIDKPANNQNASKLTERLIHAITKYEQTTIDPEQLKACQTIIRGLKRLQINEYAGTQMDAEDIIILQQVIALQTNPNNTNTLQQNIDIIRRMLQDNPNLF